MSTATTTSVSPANGTVSKGNATRRRNRNASPGPVEEESEDATAAEKPRAAVAQKKYRHVAAVHSKSRPSCLSHDSDATPSFIGFRNLMVIVLGTQAIPIYCKQLLPLTDHDVVVGNLRLMIENLKKACYNAPHP